MPDNVQVHVQWTHFDILEITDFYDTNTNFNFQGKYPS